MATDDRKLVERCKSGDRDAFKTLVSNYERAVFRIAFGVLRDSEESWDVTQEVFIKVFRYIGSFEYYTSFYVWLHRITMNLSIDYLRKRRRSAFEYDDGRKQEAPSLDRFAGSDQQSGAPDRQVLREELMGRVNAAVNKLSAKHREAIVLREVEGMSYQEIASTVGVSIGTVMSRIFHARKKIQAELGSYLEQGV